MDNKTALRLRAKSIRKTSDIPCISKNAVNQIRGLELYKKARHVLIYYPLDYEINLLELLKDSKNFYLPRVCGQELLVCPYSDELKKSELNIYEPCTNPVDASIIELAIVPALMACKAGFRLGYGGGFYDRFLAKYPNIKTICPIANELFVEDLPYDENDVKMDFVIPIS